VTSRTPVVQTGKAFVEEVSQRNEPSKSSYFFQAFTLANPFTPAIGILQYRKCLVGKKKWFPIGLKTCVISGYLEKRLKRGREFMCLGLLLSKLQYFQLHNPYS